MTDRFALSPELVARMRRSGTRASVPMQLAAAIPDPALRTTVVPAAAIFLEYSKEVVRDAPAGYWRLGDDVGTIYYDIGYILPVFQPTLFYGFVIQRTDPLAYGRPGAIATLVEARRDDAMGVLAGGGGAIVYFPSPGSESLYPNGALGMGPTQDFTWEFWIQTTQDPGAPVRLFGQEDAGVSPFGTHLLPGGSIGASRSDGVNTPALATIDPVNDGDWHYVTYSKAGGTLSLQIDRDAAATTADTVVGDTTLAVDGYMAGDGFEGALDEAAMYRHALADSAKLRHWNAAKGIAMAP